MTEDLPAADPFRVLVYSDDPAVREQVRLAVGTRPVPDVRVEFVEADDGDRVVALADTGGLDLVVLDGEAWPAGGMGVCRQLNEEVDPCPPVLLLIARRDDAWLAHWSRADRTVAFPLDPVEVAGVVAEILRPVPDPSPTRPG